MNFRNILQVTGSTNLGGGAEKHVLTLSVGLKKLGYNNILVCAEGRYAELLQELGFKVHCVNLKREGWSAIFRIYHIIKAEKIDIVHTHHYYGDKRGLIAAKLARTPVIVSTIHSKINLNDFGKPKKVNFPHRVRNKLLTHIPDKIITVSKAATEHTINQLQLKKDKVITVHNGIETEDHMPTDEDRARISREFNINPGTKYIGIVARLDMEKGHKYLFLAIKSLLGEQGDLKLLVVGSGYAEKELKQLVNELGIADKVIFTGLRSDALAIMSCMYLIVLPSLIEGFGLVLIEAMALSKPVVATRVGGMPEIIATGENGFLVPPEDPEALAGAIRKILQDEALAKQMGVAGKKLVAEKFTAEILGKNTAAVYEQIAHEKFSAA